MAIKKYARSSAVEQFGDVKGRARMDSVIDMIVFKR